MVCVRAGSRSVRCWLAVALVRARNALRSAWSRLAVALVRARNALRSAWSRLAVALGLAAVLVATLGVGNAAAAKPPSLGARAAALIEEGSGQELYGADQSAEVAIASTTKLMTALVTLH